MVQKNLIRLCMVNGKKTKSSAMVTRILKELSRSGHVLAAADPLADFAMKSVSPEATTDPYTYLKQAIDNVKPMLEIRRGKRPFAIPTYRQQQKAIRLLGKKNLLNELRNAHAKTGVARQKRDELHKQAEANR